MTLKRVPLRLLGLLLLGYVLYVVDLQAVFDQLRVVGMASLALAAVAFAALAAARCWRWHVLVRCLTRATSFAQNIVACNESIWIGMATPARVGEFSRGVELARQSGTSLRESTALVVFDLLLDLATYAVLAMGALALVTTGRTPVLSSPLYIAGLCAGLVLLASLPALAEALSRALPWLRALPGATILPTLDRALGRAAAWQVALTTAAAAICYALMMTALLAPMRLDLGFAATLSMIGLVGVAGAIPITYFGFGTREVALIWYFGALGLSKETAVAVSFSFVLAQLIGICVSLVLSPLLRRLARARNDDGPAPG